MINYNRWRSAKPVHDCGLEQTYIGIITLGSEAEYAKGSVFEYIQTGGAPVSRSVRQKAKQMSWWGNAPKKQPSPSHTVFVLATGHYTAAGEESRNTAEQILGLSLRVQPVVFNLSTLFTVVTAASRLMNASRIRLC